MAVSRQPLKGATAEIARGAPVVWVSPGLSGISHDFQAPTGRRRGSLFSCPHRLCIAPPGLIIGRVPSPPGLTAFTPGYFCSAPSRGSRQTVAARWRRAILVARCEGALTMAKNVRILMSDPSVDQSLPLATEDGGQEARCNSANSYLASMAQPITRFDSASNSILRVLRVLSGKIQPMLRIC